MTGKLFIRSKEGKIPLAGEKQMACSSQKFSAEVYREEGFGYVNEFVILSQMNWAFKDNFLLFCGMGDR